MQIVILRYNAGNTLSVKYALERLGLSPILSDEPEVLAGADKIIFPGVGHAETAMNYLKSRNLDEFIRNTTKPFLGICLGMQLLCKHSQEGDIPCLDIFDLEVTHFPKDKNRELKIPHMGWNLLQDFKSPLFKDMPEEAYVYFVHSFYVPSSAYTIASAEYFSAFSAAIQKDNFYAVQFHPEKSSEIGELILKNFIEL